MLRRISALNPAPAVRRGLARLGRAVEHIRGHNPFVRPDFDDGAATLHKYLVTHKVRYRKHVGAHFLIALIESGDGVFESFAERHRTHGWHFELTPAERDALARARDRTCMHSRTSNLRYTTNIFEQVTNNKQLVRMLGLGAAAGSAGILLGLSEILFFARETTRDFLTETLGLNWQILTTPARETDAFVELARDITTGAQGADGSLDPTIVAERIERLVSAMETAGDAEAAARVATADVKYIIGVLTGIVLLVVGRGFIQLVMEGLSGAVGKIDALVEDMDAYANWMLGRSPHAAAADRLAGPMPEALSDRPDALDAPCDTTGGATRATSAAHDPDPSRGAPQT